MNVFVNTASPSMHKPTSVMTLTNVFKVLINARLMLSAPTMSVDTIATAEKVILGMVSLVLISMNVMKIDVATMLTAKTPKVLSVAHAMTDKSQTLSMAELLFVFQTEIHAAMASIAVIQTPTA